MHNPTRAEAERILGISKKLLQNHDLIGSREFAILAQEIEPLLEGSDQILAIVDVLIASEKHVNNHPDWYAILQVDRCSDDIDLIKRQYRRFALLLHPDKCHFHFAEHAFKLIADAWALFSDPIKKSIYDKEFSFFSRVNLSIPGLVQREKLEKLPVRRAGHRHAFGSNLTVDNQGFNPRIMSSSAAREKITAEENSRRRLSVPSLVQQEKLPVQRAGHIPASGSNLTVNNQGSDPQTMSSSAARKKITAEENSRRSLFVPSMVQREKLLVRRLEHIPAFGSNLTFDNQGFDPRAARDKITAEENSQRGFSVPSLVQREKLEKLSVRRAGHGPVSRSNLPIDNHGFDPRTMSSSTETEENSQSRSASVTFWTACPYCYHLYEYPKAYEGCCLRCQNCKRSFHGVTILTLPPLVPRQDAYYCCWGVFSLEFVVGNASTNEKKDDVPIKTMPAHVPGQVPGTPMMHTTSLPNWMHVPSANNMSNVEPSVVVPMPTQMSKVAGVPNEVVSIFGSRKRGRSEKHPVVF